MSAQAPVQSSPAVHIIKLSVNAGEVGEHIDWLARLMMVGVESSGVVSAEIIPPANSGQTEWSLVQRFYSAELLESWRQSEACRALFEEIQPRVTKQDIAIGESVDTSYGTVGSVSVAIVTKVKPGQEAAYCKCEGQFQSAQARRPGYKGVYVQPPTKSTPEIWTTLNRFDSPAALDQWFSSDERKKLLEQSEQVVHSTEYQKVTTSFPGWFPSKNAGAKGPPNWKTALLILLGLYPIVMLEIRFLNPVFSGLNPALTNFIGNTLSVALTTWITMPLAIKAFSSWLFPTTDTPKWINSASIASLVCIYAIEIALLWKLL